MENWVGGVDNLTKPSLLSLILFILQIGTMARTAL